MDYFKHIDKINQETIINLYLLNNKKSLILEEALLFYFDKILKHFYFNIEELINITKNKNIYDEIPLEYFKICINNLQEINNDNKCSISELTNLVKLYSISYIKNYINIYSENIIKKNNLWNEFSFKSFHKYLNNKSSKKNDIIKVIQIYVFKLINMKLGKDFEKFLDFMKSCYKKRNILYFENFNFDSEIFKLYYSILNIDLNNQIILTAFIKEKNNKFNKKSNIPKLIRESNEPKILDIFYSVICNNLLLEYLEEDKKKLETINNFYNNISKVIIEENAFNINNIQSKILGTILNPNLFYKNIIHKLGKNININRLEILLYSFRFVLFTQKEDNNFYSNFFRNNLNDFFKNNFFPGVCPKNDIFLDNYPLIEKHLNEYPLNVGCYVCSCGKYYSVEPCGWPMQISKCPICLQEIGGQNHCLIKRDGHMRIFKDQQTFNSNREYIDDYTSGSAMTLENYKKQIIDKRQFIYTKGIFQETFNNFSEQKKKVREMDIFTYKILHFILYSHLFFLNASEDIDDNKLKEYCVESMSCIEIIESDWNYINEYLKENGGFKIQIYMHYIFESLTLLLQNSISTFKTHEKRNDFEKEVNNLVNKLNNNKTYKEYEKKYLEENKQTKVDLFSTKSIILEYIEPDNYSIESYPYLQYFYLHQIPEKKIIYEKLQKIKDYQNKYPLLETYLSEDGYKKLNLLHNLNDINNFTKALLKYECRDEMPIFEITDNSLLGDFLIDNEELYHGME